jgi:hypothetical protein
MPVKEKQREREKKREIMNGQNRNVVRYSCNNCIRSDEPAIQDEYKIGFSAWVCACLYASACIYMKKKERNCRVIFPLLPFYFLVFLSDARRAYQTSLLFSRFSEENARQSQPRD